MSVQIEINVGNLTRTINKMDVYGAKLDQAFKDGINEFGEKLRLKIIDNMGKYGVPDSVVKTVNLVHTPDGVQIHIAGELVDFFEYGTGIKGARNPHPSPFIPWVYDVNDHGSEGWWYPTTSDDPNPHKWTDPDGNLRAWTNGKVSRPFVYDAFVWGKGAITRIVRKHIKKIQM